MSQGDLWYRVRCREVEAVTKVIGSAVIGSPLRISFRLGLKEVR